MSIYVLKNIDGSIAIDDLDRFTYFINDKNGHNKFWTVILFIKRANGEIVEKTREGMPIRSYSGPIPPDCKWVVTRKWGRVGTSGQQMEELFDDWRGAREKINTLKNEKVKEGYTPVF